MKQARTNLQASSYSDLRVLLDLFRTINKIQKNVTYKQAQKSKKQTGIVINSLSNKFVIVTGMMMRMPCCCYML
jgi:hypothetical protein